MNAGTDVGGGPLDSGVERGERIVITTQPLVGVGELEGQVGASGMILKERAIKIGSGLDIALPIVLECLAHPGAQISQILGGGRLGDRQQEGKREVLNHGLSSSPCRA